MVECVAVFIVVRMSICKDLERQLFSRPRTAIPPDLIAASSSEWADPIETIVRSIRRFGENSDRTLRAVLARPEQLELASEVVVVALTPFVLQRCRPDFHRADDVAAACAVLRAAGLREQVMIDFSHANAQKQYARQIDVGHDVAAQIAGGDRRITGVMIESHLEAGRQDMQPGQPLARGVSITDACIGWAQTEPVLRALAQATRARRSVVQNTGVAR